MIQGLPKTVVAPATPSVADTPVQAAAPQPAVIKPANPHESIPANWDIKANGEDIHAVNTTTGRILDLSIKEFSAFLRA